MTQDILSSNIDPNKVFIVQRFEIEDRWDPMFYKPKIANLEKKIRAISRKKLRDYIVRISSGATPSVKDEERFYSDKENGIPFLRVQNLQINGKLSLDDVKYINKETHNNSLRRSQVSESDLLVKITGVGRMAIASVAPEGFVGNTNQHMVVIKTRNKETSDYLANYLNLDIVEKLASRRATGGTRPALDYLALKSIPIVDGIDFTVIREAEKLKERKDDEAQALLSTIDDYLLNELGIKIPEKDDSLKNRIFITPFNEITEKRFDPKSYDINTRKIREFICNVNKKKFKIAQLKRYIISSVAGDWGTEVEEENSTRCLVIRSTEFDNQNNLRLDNNRAKYRYIKKNKLHKIDIRENDLLIEKSGGSPDQPVGRIAIISNNIIDSYTICYSNFIHKIRVSHEINPMYLFYFLKTIYNIGLTDSMQSQTNGIRNLIMNEYYNQNIVLPLKDNGDIDMCKQKDIVSYINNIHIKAQRLQQEAADILKQAKKQIEEKILGETL